MHDVHAIRRGGLRAMLLGTALLAGMALLLLAIAPVAQAASLTSTLTPGIVDYGQAVTVQGTVDPVAADEQVVIALDGGDVATATTDAAGAYSASFVPTHGGSVTARLADGTTGPALTLTVRPVAVVKALQVSFWQSVKLGLTVTPSTFRGTAAVQIVHNGRVIARSTRTVTAGYTEFRMPCRGIGSFTVRITLQAWNGLAARTVGASFASTAWPRIRAGSQGLVVRALLLDLQRLRFRIPGVSTVMSRAGADSIVAFQKAYRLPRTYVFDYDDWRRLDIAALLRPRYASPSLHIEIDKTRQILMVVKGGKPLGIICVSTGATGNTPEGVHSILWKAYAAFTPYGNTYLYWDMCFHPGFAMHAYPIVPAYPASHGCVREPTWVAPWTYNQSYAGEVVYIYR